MTWALLQTTGDTTICKQTQIHCNVNMTWALLQTTGDTTICKQTQIHCNVNMTWALLQTTGDTFSNWLVVASSCL
jgi:predicted transcriptional regulator